MATAHVIVAELGDAAAGQYCGYLLAGLGAEVTKVTGNLTAETAFTDANKTLASPESDDLDALLDRADVVIDSRPVADEAEPSADVIAERNPGAVLARISWFGASGPYAGRRGSELTAAATSGYLAMNGYPDREPLKLYGVQGQRHAGLQAAIGVLAALRARERTGRGVTLDVSVHEAYVYLTAGAPLDYFYTGTVRRRAGNSQAASTRGQTYTSILPCQDGYLLLGVVGARDVALMEQLFDSSLPAHLRERPGAFEAELNEICGEWLRTRRRSEVLERAIELGLHWAVVNDMAEVAASEQTQARGFLVPGRHDGAPELLPGRPVAFSQIAWQIGH